MDDKARIKVLEARVAELENQLQRRGGGDRCPACGKGLLKIAHINFGKSRRTLKCDNEACGHVEQRRVADPAAT